MPEPELFDEGDIGHDIDAPEQERVKARIADAIRARMGQGGAAQPSVSAPLTRGRGPEPLVVHPRGAGAGLPPEPPLTAGARPVVPPAPDPEDMADMFAAPDELADMSPEDALSEVLGIMSRTSSNADLIEKAAARI